MGFLSNAFAAFGSRLGAFPKTTDAARKKITDTANTATSAARSVGIPVPGAIYGPQQPTSNITTKLRGDYVPAAPYGAPGFPKTAPLSHSQTTQARIAASTGGASSTPTAAPAPVAQTSTGIPPASSGYSAPAGSDAANRVAAMSASANNRGIPPVAPTTAPVVAPTPSIAPAAITAPAAPAAPTEIERLRKLYAGTLTPSSEESAMQSQLTDYLGNARLGVSNLEGQGRGIPLDLIRGQQSKLTEQANIGAQTLEQQLANKMAERTAQQTAYNTQLGYATQDQARQDALTAPTTVGDSILQYDPVTKTYKIMYTAPAQAEKQTADIQNYEYAVSKGYTGSPLEYQQALAQYTANPANLQYISPSATSAGGTFNPETGQFVPNAAPEASAQSQQMTQSALSAVDTLLSSGGLSGAVGAKGPSSLFGLLSSPIGGTDAANFKAQFDSLKSLLSLDNIKLLKGTGAISDAEQRMLTQASTSLSTDMSESAFKEELMRVKQVLTDSLGRGSAQQQPQDTPENRQKLLDGGMTQDEVNSYFTPDLSMSQNGSPLEIAKSYLGLNASNPKQAQTLSAFFKKAGGVDVDPATTAWCAAFLNSVLGTAGIKGTGSLMAQSFLKFGTAVKEPTKGDIVVFERGERGGWQGHVGIVAGRNDNGTLQVLGGNQDGSTNIQTFKTDRVLGYRRIDQKNTKQYTANNRYSVGTLNNA